MAQAWIKCQLPDLYETHTFVMKHLKGTKVFIKIITA